MNDSISKFINVNVVDITNTCQAIREMLAVGSCNRKGKRPSGNSFVWIFASEDKWKTSSELATQVAVMHMTADNFLRRPLIHPSHRRQVQHDRNPYADADYSV
ncbi:hypothetical protein [Haemophilus haemolyticus]|uniref:hypothetical protein n=1 Tax=Haemophilus haemolyticus TaxID=726 RepID=UPI0019594B3C|nr:hypothetical protein [Haemophilus haemolyticus]